MSASLIRRTLGLETNPDGIGSRDRAIESIEWTPGACSRVPIRSTWRDPIGKKLNNAIIARRARQGFYGKEAQLRATKKIEVSTGIVHRCSCGERVGTLWYKYRYLPKPGFYCPRCLAVHRAAHDKDARARERFNELMARKYV